MDLPTPHFIRSLRADISALHHTLHSLALSNAESVSSCQFDASLIDGEQWALRARLGKLGAQAEVAAAHLPTKEAAARLLEKLAGGATQTDNASPAIAAQREVSVEPAGYGCGCDSIR